MSRTKPSLPSDPSPCPLPTPTSTQSFWHSEPSPLLTAHRSTRNLPEEADVVVIGSGMTGASVAHHLLNDESMYDGRSASGKKGLRVVMLEAREACWGATGRNGGHCQPLMLEYPNDPSIPSFELRNFHALHQLSTAKQIPCEFVPQPGVRAIYSLSNLHGMELALHSLQTTAPELAKLSRITRDENELAALRVPGALGAVVTSVAARMWPYKFVARILEDLLTASSLPSGGSFNLQTLTPVTGLSRAVQGWNVETERGMIHASKVILATNAYTSHLLPTLSDLIVPVRGQMSALHPFPSLMGPNRLKTSFGFAGDGIDDYLVQRPNESGGHLMFGGGRQLKSCVGETDDSIIDESTAKYLRTRLIEALGLPEKQAYETEIEKQRESSRLVLTCDYCRRRKIKCSGPTPLPVNSGDNRCTNCVRFTKPCGSFSTHHLHKAPAPIPREIQFAASHEWTGIMGFSRDDLPWVGEVPAPFLNNTSDLTSFNEETTGLFIAAGYTGHGMPNTWLCGAAVAQMALGADMEKVAQATGLPGAYLMSEERVARAREEESVHAKDLAEMERARRRGERPASGYA